MEKTGMNKRFNVYCSHDWTKPYDRVKGERTINFIFNILDKEDRDAANMYCFINDKVAFNGNKFRFTYDKAHRRFATWSDEQITSAIETLMKYGFLVKVDNNTARFCEDGNEALIASMVKESA